MLPQLVGIVNALLLTIGMLAQTNDPQYKITPVGFLQMLLENSSTAQVSNLDSLRMGYDRSIKVRYMQRSIETDAVDEDNCDTDVTAAWNSIDIGKPLFSKIGVGIDDNLVRQLQDGAAQGVTLGNPAANVYVALYQTILTQLNGLVQKINKNLLAAQSTAWGVNAVTGAATPTTINFANTPTINDGVVKLLSDYQYNEISGIPQIVGNGVAVNYDILQSLKKGYDGGGFGANMINIYPDVNTVSAWGANHFGVFVPGLTAFVDYNKYVGAFAGLKGGSLFFTMPVPVQLAGGKLSTLILDCQLKYNDCPDAELGINRGYVIQITKNYGLFNAPNDMFKAADRLKGFNGSLHYIGAIATPPVTEP